MRACLLKNPLYFDLTMRSLSETLFVTVRALRVLPARLAASLARCLVLASRKAAY